MEKATVVTPMSGKEDLATEEITEVHVDLAIFSYFQTFLVREIAQIWFGIQIPFLKYLFTSVFVAFELAVRIRSLINSSSDTLVC